MTINHRGISTVLAVLSLLVIGILIGAGGYYIVISGPPSTVTTTTTTETSVRPITATTAFISLNSVYSTYLNNQAAGNAQYTGMTIYAHAESGSVTEQKGDYYSWCIMTLTTNQSPCGDTYIMFIWESQMAATQVPTNGSYFPIKCTVDNFVQSDSIIEGQIIIEQTLILKDCSVIGQS